MVMHFQTESLLISIKNYFDIYYGSFKLLFKYDIKFFSNFYSATGLLYRSIFDINIMIGFKFSNNYITGTINE